MLLRGITGFYDGHQPPLPMLNTKCFDRFCYALVRAHGGAVRSLEAPDRGGYPVSLLGLTGEEAQDESRQDASLQGAAPPDCAGGACSPPQEISNRIHLQQPAARGPQASVPENHSSLRQQCLLLGAAMPAVRQDRRYLQGLQLGDRRIPDHRPLGERQLGGLLSSSDPSAVSGRSHSDLAGPAVEPMAVKRTTRLLAWWSFTQSGFILWKTRRFSPDFLLCRRFSGGCPPQPMLFCGGGLTPIPPTR